LVSVTGAVAAVGSRHLTSYRRHPGGPYVHGVALFQGQRLGVARVIWAVNGPPVAVLVNSTRPLKPSRHHPVNSRCHYPDGRGGAVTAGDRHVGFAAHPDVVRAHWDTIQRRHRTIPCQEQSLSVVTSRQPSTKFTPPGIRWTAFGILFLLSSERLP
jgi:hypothetical protein